MPVEVWFYHLERTGLDQALPELLEKTLGRGWRAIVRTRQPERVAALDAWLWTYRDESFLPHGPDDEPGASRQPILLTTGFDNANAAQALFLIDGAEAGTVEGYERCLVLFDGGDEAQLAVARAQWSALKREGLNLSYWRQMARGWEKQA
jgi:DNA polymerase-3 subunit chi